MGQRQIRPRPLGFAFLPFTCEITEFVQPGTQASLVIGVDSTRSGLGDKHAGWLEPVRLFAEPASYISRFHISTDLDSQYRDATMKVWLRMDFHGAADAHVKLSLKDTEGRPVALSPSVVELTAATPETITDVPVDNPLKWDAEHPRLYTLKVSVIGGDGAVLETLSRRFGFVKIERAGRRVLINGREVKPRGGGWYGGGYSVQEMVDNNMNHTRAKSAYEELLDDCDQLGIYALDEDPVDFAKNRRQ